MKKNNNGNFFWKTSKGKKNKYSEESNFKDDPLGKSDLNSPNIIDEKTESLDDLVFEKIDEEIVSSSEPYRCHCFDKKNKTENKTENKIEKDSESSEREFTDSESFDSNDDIQNNSEITYNLNKDHIPSFDHKNQEIFEGILTFATSGTISLNKNFGGWFTFGSSCDLSLLPSTSDPRDFSGTNGFVYFIAPRTMIVTSITVGYTFSSNISPVLGQSIQLGIMLGSKAPNPNPFSIKSASLSFTFENDSKPQSVTNQTINGHLKIPTGNYFAIFGCDSGNYRKTSSNNTIEYHLSLTYI